MFNPEDPLYEQQWHLARIGNLRAVWEDYNGSGVQVGVFDDGIQASHPDLAANYDASLEFSYLGGVHNSSPNGNSPHGTSVAGLIGAAANDTGGVGVAFGTSLTSVNIFDPTSDLFINAAVPSGFFAAVAYTAFDVVNNSWGSTPSFSASQNVNVAGSFAQLTVAGWENVAQNGRGGLGTVVLKAAGNDSRNANGESSNAARQVINVAAVADSGFAASYSNYGANILVSAPGSEFSGNGGLGIVTSDLIGADGYNLRSDPAGSFDYTDDFGGTSAATPIVTGVVALMLDANEGLGWRDVQTILSLSATHTGSSLTAVAAAGFESGTWNINDAKNWNGGGMHFHASYGYGMVNAYNAARMAEVWGLFSPVAQTSANEGVTSLGDLTSRLIPDLAITDVPLTLATDMLIENVQVTLSLTHSFFTDLVIELISPTGDVYTLADGSAGGGSTSDGTFTWTFGINGLRGELVSAGQWIVRVRDIVPGDSGTLHSVNVTFYGTPASADDTYHFTDEFQMMAMLDNSRRLVTDTDGGTDWLNMAAVSGDVVLNLGQGLYSSVNGQQFIRIAAGTEIENAVTGDGNDLIFGNALGNKLHGMRGDDDLRGRGGADILDGGRGNDRMFGGEGDDTYFIDSLLDRVWETTNSASTTVADAGGFDTINSSVSFNMNAYNGVRYVEDLNLTGEATHATGNDFSNVINGNNRSNTISGGLGADRLLGQDGHDLLYGEGDADRLAGANGNDLLDGGTGADIMLGGANDDTYVVDNIFDRVFETLTTSSADTSDAGGMDTINSSISLSLDAYNGVRYVENLTLTGIANINAVGNALANTLIGNSGANRLDGGTGGDRMLGGAGDDVYFVDNAADRVFETTTISTVDNTDAGGIDTINTTLGFNMKAYNGLQFVEKLILLGTADINAIGNDLGNTLTGNSGINRLDGGIGSDRLAGGAGADTLLGGQGTDWLQGGTARDVITGGTEADQFAFDDADFGGADAVTADRILDFTSADSDRIHLSLVDANSANGATDDAFTFIGTSAFGSVAGELRYEQIAGHTYVQGDVDGNGAADFWIRLDGLKTLVSGDFVL